MGQCSTLCQDQLPGLIINKLSFSLTRLRSEECTVVSVWNTNYFNLNEMSNQTNLFHDSM